MIKKKYLNVHYYVELSSATLYARALPLSRSLKKYGINSKVVSPINWFSIGGETFCEIMSIFLTHSLRNYINTIQSRPDVVIIGRSSSINLFLFLKVLKLRGTKVIFDLDDAVILPSILFFGKRVRSPAYFCAEKMLMQSDAVLVNGTYLLSYAKCFNEKTFVIHVPVDTNLFHPRKRKYSAKVTIGWQGNPANHYDNLALLIKPLEALAKEYIIRFKITSCMGDDKIRKMFRRLEQVMEIDYGPDHWLPMEGFAEQLFDYDIMVAPLVNNDWNQGKSALRVSAGMAMGIPIVASPIGEQRYIIHHGINGFLSSNEQEWYSYLKALIEDGQLRLEMGKHARDTSENELSLNSSGKKLNSIIRSL